MALPATEDFSTANDPLTNSADWGQCGATSDSGRASGGQFSDNSANSNDKSAYWVSDAFGNDQYSQILIATHGSGTRRIGVILRGGSGNEALLLRYLVNSGDFEGYRWDSGGTRQALTGNPYTPSDTVGSNDTIRGEINSTTLTLKVDYGAGFVTETTWDASAGPASGSAGLYIVDTGTNTIGDDWEGGDLAAGGVTGTSATTNAVDTQAASGQLTNSGVSAAINAADSQAAAGVVGIVGAAASINNPDIQTAAGQLTNSGNAAIINADDAQAANGGLLNDGSSATTNAADTQAALGELSNIGSSAPVNANDVQAASGVVSSAGITGTSITTNAADAQATLGVLSNVGTISVINNHDAQAANGLIGVPPNDVTFIRLTDRYSLIRTTGSFTMDRTTNDFTLIRNTG